jgi:hypothetical protein
MASARILDCSNTARPMMLWPEARWPSVAIVGATAAPSADTHATSATILAIRKKLRTYTWHKCAEEVLDRLSGVFRGAQQGGYRFAHDPIYG